MVIRRPRRSRRALVIVIVLAILLLAGALARFYTDILWFREVHLTSVLWTSLVTEIGVGVVTGIVVALIIYGNLVVAGRLAPRYRTRFQIAGRPDPFDQYRDALAPYVGRLRLGLAAAVGLLAGLSGAGSWQTVLLYLHRVNFQAINPAFTPDQQFHKDIGFYVFELPFFRTLLGMLWFALFAAIVLSVAAHYFHGAIRPERSLSAVLPGALAHISVLLGLLALVKTGQYFIGQYALNFSPSGTVTGASYTDVHARLPALKLLMVISVISAILFLVNIRARRVSLPLAAVGIWVLTSVLAGGVWPLWVQKFSVAPQEPQREAPYIQRNLDATRTAFGLNDVKQRPFAATAGLSASQLASNQPSLNNVRLWDPDVLALAYNQLQAIRTYYDFPDVDVDRYQVNGAMRQVLLSARELSPNDLPSNSKTWSNVHLQYTHGYGLSASLANVASSAGQPDFLVKDLPGTVAPGAESLSTGAPGSATAPRIYYGEEFQPSDYSVVDSKQKEVDYPTSQDQGLARNTYPGTGGVPVGGFFDKVLFAIRERDPNLVLSSLISSQSRILIYKNVRDRVLRAAPFLSLDNDPYPAVVDGRLVWILDAYTSSPWYPYSERFNVSDILGSDQNGSLGGNINYLNNSVKIVVDALDGTMKFYVVNPDDPIIQAWRSAFPALFTSDPPSSSLREHFRYPEDLFNVQSDVYLTYHMKDPQNFYSKEDAWNVPANPQIGSTLTNEPPLVPPTYLLFKLPGDSSEEFLLTRPFTPRGKNNMIAIMAARSDPQNYGQLVTLELPRQSLVAGPSQVDNLINQDVRISKLLTLLKSQGSTVEFGSLVTLPIEDSLVYVQPLFVRASSGGIPELKKVVVVYGEQVKIGDTFEQALGQIFNLQPPTPGGPGGGGKGGGGKGGQGGGKGGGQGGGGKPSAELQRTIHKAGVLYSRAQQALSNGDFTTYAKLIQRVGDLLNRAQSLSR